MNKQHNQGRSCSLAILILAAGQSKRLGQPKQLVQFQGQSLIAKQCQLALSISEHVYCVLGYQSELVANQVAALPVNLIKNEQWMLGMGSSISTGVNALAEHFDGVLILLVDQWRVTKDELTQLASTFELNMSSIIQSEFSQSVSEDNIATDSKHSKQNGPPIIFPKSLFGDLIKLSAEQGAKSIVQAHASSTIKVCIPNAGVDLDTPEQLINMHKMAMHDS